MFDSLACIFRDSIVEQAHGRLNKVIVKSKLNDAIARLERGWKDLFARKPLAAAVRVNELCDTRFILRIVQTLRDEVHVYDSIGKSVLLNDWYTRTAAHSAQERENAAAYFEFLYNAVDTVLRTCLGTDRDAPHYERFSSWLIQAVGNDTPVRTEAAPEHFDTQFDTQRYIEELRWRLSQNPDNLGAVLSLSRALFALSCEQDTESKRETVRALHELCDAYPAQPDVALDYSNALVTLSFVQDTNEIETSIAELKRLAAAFPHSVGIEEAYAYGLLHYTTKQNMREGSNTIRLLRKTAEANHYNEDITAAYATALCHLSERQSTDEAAATLESLRRYVEKNVCGENVLLIYTQGMTALYARQNDGSQTLIRLRRFAQTYHHSSAVALSYVRTAVSVKDRYKLDDAVRIARDYFHKYPNDIRFAKAYTEALASFSTIQSLSEAEKTISQLEQISALNPLAPDLQISLAKGLCRLSVRQEPRDMELTVRQLRALQEQNPGNTPLLQYYTTGLAQLCACKNREISHNAMTQLAALHIQYAEQETIRRNYAVGLCHLIHQGGESTAVHSLSAMMLLLSRYPDDETLRELYRTTLRSLTVGEDAATDYRFLFSCLQQISQDSGQPDDVRTELAKLLVLVSAGDRPDVTEEATALLEHMLRRDAGNGIVAAEYAKTLIRRAQTRPSRANEKRLHRFVWARRGNTSVACLYAGHLLKCSGEAVGRKAYARMRSLYRTRSDCAELALLFAKAARIFNGRSLSGLMTAARTLRLLWGDFPDNDEFRLLYADSVYRLYEKQVHANKLTEASGALDVMRKLAYTAPEGDVTQAVFANMLMEIIRRLPLSRALIAVSELKSLSERFPNTVDITICFAQGLYNLSALQSTEEALATMQIVRMITRQYTRHECFAAVTRACDRRIEELRQDARGLFMDTEQVI